MSLCQALIIIAIITFQCVVTAADTGSGFVLQAEQNGSYSIVVHNDTWLSSAASTMFLSGKRYSSTNGTLKLQHTSSKSGSDSLGLYKATSYVYAFNLVKGKTITYSIRDYSPKPFAIFSQDFNSDFKPTSTGDVNAVVSAFPSFKTSSGAAKLGFLEYTNTFYNTWIIEKWDKISKVVSGEKSGPLVLFDTEGSAMVISPFSQFMAASLSHDAQDGGSISWGIQGNVNSINQGFRYETIVYYSSEGINKAFEGWGEVLLRQYKKDASSSYQDPSVMHLGYYTGNGGYYYNVTEPGMNYEQTIIAILDYGKKQGIPYRFLQLDDWWYYITWGEGYGAVLNWVSRPDIFPHGMSYLYNITRLPVVAHNRYWSNRNVYAKQNGGAFDFYINKKNALPLTQVFWDTLFSNAVQWGMAIYEQDWMNLEYEDLPLLNSDLEMGHLWLQQMGESASRFGVRIHYCMPLPRHLLQSVQSQAVSQIRVSNDYVQPNNWMIGIGSIVSSNLGLRPCKDAFWSKSVQPGNKYKLVEHNPLLQATVALLSTGPVGSSDRIGYSNPDLLRSLVNQDGLLLKPSKAITSVNDQILQRVFGGSIGPVGEVWTTHSEISNIYFGIIFAAAVTNNYTLGPTKAGFGQKFAKSVLYSNMSSSEYQAGVALPSFSDAAPLTVGPQCTYKQHCLYFTAPLLSYGGVSVALLGEMSKVVPMSPYRVTDIVVSSMDIEVRLTGAPGESVRFDVYHVTGASVKTYKCILDKTGRALLSLTVDNSYCHA